MPTSPRRHPLWVVMPPPLLFAAAFGIGLVLDRAIPSARVVSLLERAHSIGLASVIAGLLLAASASGLFLLRQTTIIPHGTARSLVRSGPYRLTRNPMYLGLILIYVGSTILARSYGPLATLVLPLWALQTRIIPYEERALADRFGQEFREYASRTHRWI